MINWKIKVFSPTGVSKVEYDNEAPGGIVSSIKFDLEPSGNCLSGSFEGIPFELDIAPRDIIQIEIEEENLFFGIVNSMPNINSKSVGMYSLEGAKKLYYDTLIDRFWYAPNPATLPAAYDATGTLLKHSYIVEALHAFRPAVIASTMVNGASTTSGNKAPIIAQDYALGEVLDAIIFSSADDEVYHWGVNGEGQFFVNKESDFATPIDFNSVNRRVELTSQDVDDTKTAVRFTFSVPENYYHPQLKTISNVTYGTASTPANDRKKEMDKFAPITYEYVDQDAVDEYGKITTVVPLILTDTWMKFVRWDDAAAMHPDITLDNQSGNSSWMWTDMRTQANSANFTDQLNAISTRGTSTYIQNNVAIAGPRGLQMTLRVGPLATTSAPTGVFPDIGLIGYYFRASAIPSSNRRPILWYHFNVYAKPVATTNEPRYDYTIYYPAEDTEFTYDDVSVYSLITKPALNEWEMDPEALNSAGFKHGDYRYFAHHIWMPANIPSPLINGNWVPGGNINVGDFKVYEYFCLFLNTEALDSYAKTFITLPEDFPSRVTVQEDLGLGYEAELDEMTINVVKLSYEISNNRGFVVTYTTGKDPDRSNKFLTRLMARDYAARNSALFLSQARV